MKILSLKSFTIIILSVIISQSCKEDFVNNKTDASYEFKYISACGWCAGSYELNIVKNMATFQYHAVCDNSPRSSERELTENELEKLNLSKLYSEIKILDINECGVCYDGCDEKITFIEDDNEYSIRFTSDEKITHLKEHLLSIRELFNEMDNESLTK